MLSGCITRGLTESIRLRILHAVWASRCGRARTSPTLARDRSFRGSGLLEAESWPDSLTSTISKVVSPKLKFGVRLLQRAGCHLGHGPHHAIRPAGLEVSRLVLGSYAGTGQLCDPQVAEWKRLEHRA